MELCANHVRMEPPVRPVQPMKTNAVHVQMVNISITKHAQIARTDLIIPMQMLQINHNAIMIAKRHAQNPRALRIRHRAHMEPIQTVAHGISALTRVMQHLWFAQ